jgi:hypothetical protein
MVKARNTRCTSKTLGDQRRCTRRTSRGKKCAQHLARDGGLLIAPSRINGAGLGLFTLTERAAGDRIAPYTGQRVHIARSDATTTCCSGGEYVLQISKTDFIDAADPTSCAARYCNTARAHNVRNKECRGNNARFTIDRRRSGSSGSSSNGSGAWITASKRIRPGDEVYVAYGPSYRFPLETKQQQPSREEAQRNHARRPRDASAASQSLRLSQGDSVRSMKDALGPAAAPPHPDPELAALGVPAGWPFVQPPPHLLRKWIEQGPPAALPSLFDE